MDTHAISGLQCPFCAALNRHLGDGADFADRLFNASGDLWGACEVHAVRWHVGRELLGIPAGADSLGLPEVEGVWLPD